MLRLSRLVLLAVGMMAVQQLKAEGMLDLHPHVGGSVNHDTNLFRFASEAEAKAAGIPQQSDTIKRLDVGLDGNLRLSRQLVRLNVNLNQSQFSKNRFLDNTGRSLRLAWMWHIGSNLYGELSTSNDQSIAGFADNDIIQRNLRTFNRQRLSVNWRYHPDWSVYFAREAGEFKNDLQAFRNLDTTDDVYETGLRYEPLNGTQLNLFYRYVDTDFPIRTDVARFFFGVSTLQKQYGFNLAWQASNLTRLSLNLSQMDIVREGAPQRDFEGINQRWTLVHTLSEKTSISASAFREVSAIDDFLSSYAEFKGGDLVLVWRLSPNLSLNTRAAYIKRAFLGGNALLVSPIDREDATRVASVNLTYAPTNESLLQISFVNEQRDANFNELDFAFKSINILARHAF